MGLYDALTLTNAKTGWGDVLKGSYSISMGDNLSAFIGSGRQTHIVGDEIKYVLDWMGCLQAIPYIGGFLNSLPLSLLMGEGGNMTWTFGRKTDLHYIGPAISITRAGKRNATSKTNFFAPEKETKPAAKDQTEWDAEQETKASIDLATGIMVALFSSALMIVNTTVEIVARYKYVDKSKKTKQTAIAANTAAEKEAIAENNQSMKEGIAGLTTYCTATLMLTTRVMSVIKIIELTAATARTEASNFFEAGAKAKNIALAALTAGGDKTVRDDAEKRLKRAGSLLLSFIKMTARVLLVITIVLSPLIIMAAVGLAVQAAS